MKKTVHASTLTDIDLKCLLLTSAPARLMYPCQLGLTVRRDMVLACLTRGPVPTNKTAQQLSNSVFPEFQARSHRHGSPFGSRLQGNDGRHCHILYISSGIASDKGHRHFERCGVRDWPAVRPCYKRGSSIFSPMTRSRPRGHRKSYPCFGRTEGTVTEQIGCIKPPTAVSAICHLV